MRERWRRGEVPVDVSGEQSGWIQRCLAPGVGLEVGCGGNFSELMIEM